MTLEINFLDDSTKPDLDKFAMSLNSKVIKKVGDKTIKSEHTFEKSPGVIKKILTKLLEDNIS